MMTGSSDEPRQNVIPTEGRSGPSGGIYEGGWSAFLIPHP